VCAGAGGKLFEAVGAVDLIWTGELRHHDVLARVEAGTSVVLCDHTNTERGFSARLAARLAGAVPGLDVVVSARDREPLEIR
jgi:putative NIF3 family GTP cyclohydrolase 1 type 2